MSYCMVSFPYFTQLSCLFRKVDVLKVLEVLILVKNMRAEVDVYTDLSSELGLTGSWPAGSCR